MPMVDAVLVCMKEASGFQLRGDAAAAYEEYVGRIMAPWVDDLLAAAPPARGDVILDIACGTGFVARQVAGWEADLQVAGIDLNPSMIEEARRRATAEGSTSIEWRTGDAGALDIHDQSIDRIYCQQGMQFFPDPAAAARQMHRVLRPGGTVVANVWAPCIQGSYFDHLASCLRDHLGRAAADGFYAIYGLQDPGELTTLFADAGFGSINETSRRRGYRIGPARGFFVGHVAGLPVAPAIRALTPQASAAFFDDLRARCRPLGLEDLLFEADVTTAVAVR